MNWTKAAVLSLAIVGLGQAQAAAPATSNISQPAPASLVSALQTALATSEKQATTQALNFDDARAAALAALQAVIIESGEQPLTVQTALTAVTAETRPGAVALDLLRGRVQSVMNDCALQAAGQSAVRAKPVSLDSNANRDASQTASNQPLNGCAAGLSVASTGAGGGLGLFGPPSFSAGGSDYTPAP